jgi:hypothetical protein
MLMHYSYSLAARDIGKTYELNFMMAYVILSSRPTQRQTYVKSRDMSGKQNCLPLMIKYLTADDTLSIHSLPDPRDEWS